MLAVFLSFAPVDPSVVVPMKNSILERHQAWMMQMSALGTRRGLQCAKSSLSRVPAVRCDAQCRESRNSLSGSLCESILVRSRRWMFINVKKARGESCGNSKLRKIVQSVRGAADEFHNAQQLIWTYNLDAAANASYSHMDSYALIEDLQYTIRYRRIFSTMLYSIIS